MKLIIGLGNPGSEYAKSRHNVGYMLIDHIAEEFDASWHSKPKFKGELAEFAIGAEKIVLLKPTTFYNLVGEAAQAVSAFYKIDTSEILAIHDELALPFGMLRTRTGGTDAGNNGIKNLTSHLGEGYARIRVGIANHISLERPPADFVLSPFLPEELTQLQSTIATEALRFVEHFIHEDKQFQHTSVKTIGT